MKTIERLLEAKGHNIKPDFKAIAVEPIASSVLSSGKPGPTRSRALVPVSSLTSCAWTWLMKSSRWPMRVRLRQPTDWPEKKGFCPIPFAIHYLAAFGPMLAALLVTGLVTGSEGLKELFL